MEAVPQPHENWKTMLLAGRVDQKHVYQFAMLLGTIHRRSAESAATLREVFDDRGFFESLRIEPYYAYTAEQVPAAREFIDRLIADTRARRIALVHGDYSPKNVLIRNGQLILLDHEVIHWGDPAFDVGFAMTHFLSKGHHLRPIRREFVKSAISFWVNYEHHAGPLWSEELGRMAVRHTLACLLARVRGRSPLEYLDDAERQQQERAVVSMMQNQPDNLTDLTSRFLYHSSEGGIADD
jgi:aminoglycoside phosphotransferase (APT) family kinase protein